MDLLECRKNLNTKSLPGLELYLPHVLLCLPQELFQRSRRHVLGYEDKLESKQVDLLIYWLQILRSNKTRNILHLELQHECSKKEQSSLPLVLSFPQFFRWLFDGRSKTDESWQCSDDQCASTPRTHSSTCPPVSKIEIQCNTSSWLMKRHKSKKNFLNWNLSRVRTASMDLPEPWTFLTRRTGPRSRRPQRLPRCPWPGKPCRYQGHHDTWPESQWMWDEKSRDNKCWEYYNCLLNSAVNVQLRRNWHRAQNHSF